METVFFTLTYAEWIGLIGVILTLLAYFLLQISALDSKTLAYSLLNAISSILLLISLFYHRNLPSVIIEVLWLVMSIYGMGRSLLVRTLPKKPLLDSSQKSGRGDVS